jgi:hypothetical protein
MPTQSQKNSFDIIKLQGEMKLINQKLETITNNHLHHLDLEIKNIKKIAWVILTISLSSLLSLVSSLLN